MLSRDSLEAWVRGELDELGAFVSQPVGGFLAGVALAVVAFVVLFLGATLLVAGYDKAGRPELPRWHPRRWVAPSLDWYVGMLLIGLDGVLYGYFAILLLTSEESIPAWFGFIAAYGFVFAVLAFRQFAIERRRK